MQTKSIVAALKNERLAMKQGCDLPESRATKGTYSECNHLKVTRRTRANSEALSQGEAPIECRHQLTDYRNENEVIVEKILSIKKAFALNARMAGTGMGWNRITGY